MFEAGFKIIDETGPEAQEEKRQNLIDAHLREYEGARTRGLEATMEAVATILKEEFNVDIDNVEETRQPVPEPEAPAEVERAVPDQPVERAVAAPAKKTAARKGTAASIRGGRK